MYSAGITDERIAQALNVIGKDFVRLEAATQLLQNKLTATQLPLALLKELTKLPKMRYAVRSSGVGEDGLELSFAGQHKSYLNCKTLHQYVRNVWLSAFNSRALYYRVINNLIHVPIRQAVIIQEMVEPEIAGVAFSADPRSGDRDVVLIEHVQGLADNLVSGSVTPIRNVFRHDSAFIENDRLQVIAKTTIELQHIFGWPVDIEWAWRQQLYLLQIRPLTALPKAYDPGLVIKIALEHDVYGDPLYIGESLTQGSAEVLGFITREQANETLQTTTGFTLSKRILLVHFTTPDDLPIMEKVAGIVVDEGSITSHAAIICRELGKPCIKVLDINMIQHNNEGYTRSLFYFDGGRGTIYKMNEAQVCVV